MLITVFDEMFTSGRHFLECLLICNTSIDHYRPDVNSSGPETLPVSVCN